MPPTHTESALGEVISSVANGLLRIFFIPLSWVSDIGLIGTDTLGSIGTTSGSLVANLMSWAPLAVSRLDAMFQPMTEGIKETKEIVNVESSSEE